MSSGWMIAVGIISGTLSIAIVGFWNIMLGMRVEWREAKKRVPKMIFEEEKERLGTLPLQYSGSDKGFIRLLLWIDKSVFLRPKSTPKQYFVIRDYVQPFGGSFNAGTLLVDSERVLVINLNPNGTETIQHLVRSVIARARGRQRTVVMPTTSGSTDIVRAVTVRKKPKSVTDYSITYDVVQPKPREKEITAICNISEVPENSIFLCPAKFKGRKDAQSLDDLNGVPRFSPARNQWGWRLMIPVSLLGYLLGFLTYFQN